MLMKKIYFFYVFFFLFSPIVNSSDMIITTDNLEGINCQNFYPNFKNVSILKKQLEYEKNLENFFPITDPKYEIIWYDNDLIKAIIEIDTEGIWNGSIHSWYKSGEYLGCAGLKNKEHLGISIAYHKNGKVRAIANFKNGLPFGLEYQFNEKGHLRGIKNHELISNDEIKKNSDIH